MAKLVIFKNRLCSDTFDLTTEQVQTYFKLIDYTEEQYAFLSKVTGIPIEYFRIDSIDYYIED